MTKENKYYTPEIDEFYVGFEFEILNHKDFFYIPHLPELSWNNGAMDIFGILGEMPNIFKLIKEKQIRVKYLNEDDIISLGFGLSDKIDPSYGRVVYEKISTDGFTFPPRKETTTIRVEQGRIRILFWEDNHYGNETTQLFYGQIKNKSELKRLLVQFGIIKST